MGGCGSSSVQPEDAKVLSEMREANMDIERTLRTTRKKELSLVKLLLLGGGESGKSTFAKQMRLMFLEGFGEKTREEFRSIIFSNILWGFRNACIATEHLSDVSFLEKNRDGVSSLVSMVSSFHSFTPPLTSILKDIWSDPCFQSALSKRNLLDISDGFVCLFIISFM